MAHISEFVSIVPVPDFAEQASAVLALVVALLFLGTMVSLVTLALIGLFR